MLKITKLQLKNNEVNIQTTQAIKGGYSTLGTPNPLISPLVPSLTSYSYEPKRDLFGYSFFSW